MCTGRANLYLAAVDRKFLYGVIAHPP